MPRRTRPAFALLAALAALAAPAAARADDAQMKAGIVPALDALVPHELAVSKAIAKVGRRGRSAVPAAQRRTRRATEAAQAFAGLLLGQQPSSPRGERVKRLLLRALAIEQRAYRLVHRSLRSYRGGERRRAGRLMEDAAARLRKAQRLGRRAGRLLARL